MKRFAIFLIALSACEAPQTQEELTAKLQTACTSYGFVPGTSEMAQCVQQEAASRRAAAATMAAAPPLLTPVNYTNQMTGVANPRLQTTCQQIGTMTYCN
ncbi:hypothetical protein [Haematobacter sp. UBA3484]|uniref:hypothetical protein n=1 Tax=Haematobacter sp. UBA3484 TaxID=1946582 RepID=UPI0025B8DCB1|nr:hypothetical protein [Haematobacter sp. UBA3484]